MNILQQFETQYGFTYPPEYHRLYEAGMLDWGTCGPDWVHEYLPKLRKHPPLLLYANDFELMGLEDIRNQLEEFADPGYWMGIHPDLQFVPFAQNGAGDWYCFLPTGGAMPVVFLRHDANRATYKARNLRDFIFRCMLEAVADIEEAEYGILADDGFRDDLQRFHLSHAPFLDAHQLKTLTEIYEREGTEKRLLPAEELQGILHREMGWSRLDEDFTYTA